MSLNLLWRYFRFPYKVYRKGLASGGSLPQWSETEEHSYNVAPMLIPDSNFINKLSNSSAKLYAHRVVALCCPAPDRVICPEYFKMQRQGTLHKPDFKCSVLFIAFVFVHLCQCKCSHCKHYRVRMPKSALYFFRSNFCRVLKYCSCNISL